jgi:hypothetical protein
VKERLVRRIRSKNLPRKIVSKVKMINIKSKFINKVMEDRSMGKKSFTRIKKALPILLTFFFLATLTVTSTSAAPSNPTSDPAWNGHYWSADGHQMRYDGHYWWDDRYHWRWDGHHWWNSNRWWDGHNWRY